jgi:cell division protein FtsL
MMRRLPPPQYGNPRVLRQRDWRVVRRQVVLLACGLLMAGGFVLAVGQRFAAVRYGYGSEQLREERARLVAERERLLLELSAATAPGSLEQAARQIGMQPARASQIGGARADEDRQQPRQTMVVAARVGVVRQR